MVSAPYVEHKGRCSEVIPADKRNAITDKDGNKRRTAEVVADSVYFGDSKRKGKGGDTDNTTTPETAATPDQKHPQFIEVAVDDEELPF